MVLVDTSVWIEYFRKGEPALAALLSDASVLMHPLIAGELACGNLKHRNLILRDLEERRLLRAELTAVDGDLARIDHDEARARELAAAPVPEGSLETQWRAAWRAARARQ